MALIRMNFFSEVLNMPAPVTVILPQPRDAGVEWRDIPTLYLLHGLGDDHTSWLRKTAIERYALEAGLAVVMPDGACSCYENMAHGARYRDYVTGELPRVMRQTFPLSAARERNFLAGCSMGGCGTMKLGFAEPERWSAIGVFSASHKEFRPESPRIRAALWRVYGGDIDSRDARVTRDILRANASGPELRLWHAWGNADRLKGIACESRDFFESLPPGHIHYEWAELPGSHDWALWDAAIARFIEWLDLPKPEVHLF